MLVSDTCQSGLSVLLNHCKSAMSGWRARRPCGEKVAEEYRKWEDSYGNKTLWHVKVYSSGWMKWTIGFWFHSSFALLTHNCFTLLTHYWLTMCNYFIDLPTKERCFGAYEEAWQTRSLPHRLPECCQDALHCCWSAMPWHWGDLCLSDWPSLPLEQCHTSDTTRAHTV